MKSRQQAFDRAFSVVCNQGRRSTLPSSGEICAYRGTGGTMCGVGALINDDVYCDALEHLTVEDVPVVDAVKASGWPTDEQSLWMYGRIQQIHDSLLADHGDTFRRQWYHQCCELAAALDLTAPDRPNLRGR